MTIAFGHSIALTQCCLKLFKHEAGIFRSFFFENYSEMHPGSCCRQIFPYKGYQHLDNFKYCIFMFQNCSFGGKHGP